MQTRVITEDSIREQELYTIAETFAFLCISRKTLYNYAKEGLIKVTPNTKGCVRFKGQDLLAFKRGEVKNILKNKLLYESLITPQSSY